MSMAKHSGCSQRFSLDLVGYLARRRSRAEVRIHGDHVIGTAGTASHTSTTMRSRAGLSNVKRLDDCFGDFPVRAVSAVPAVRFSRRSWRVSSVSPEDDAEGTRPLDALGEVSSEGCRGGGICEAQVVRGAENLH